MPTRTHLLAILFAVTSLTAVLGADTLYLRNGTRVDGILVGADSRTIQFEEERGGQRRVREYDRDDVLRIELEPRRQPPGRGGREGRPSGMRERLVTVTANVAWNDTGVDVRPGQEIYFEASGRVRWGQNRTDGPEGEHNSPS